MPDKNPLLPKNGLGTEQYSPPARGGVRGGGSIDLITPHLTSPRQGEEKKHILSSMAGFRWNQGISDVV